MVVRDRVYRFKGGKIHRYEIVFEQAGREMELLGRLTRVNADLLMNGVLRGIVSDERRR